MTPERGDDFHRGSVAAQRDVVEQISAPFTLAPGHPMRRLRCLLCGMRVGGRDVRSAVVVDYRGLGCACGAIPSAAYLICAEHDDGRDLDVATPAMTRYHQHHRPRS